MYCSCNETFCSLNCMYKWHKLKPINTSCIAESKQLGLMGLNYKIRKKT